MHFSSMRVPESIHRQASWLIDGFFCIFIEILTAELTDFMSQNFEFMMNIIDGCCWSLVYISGVLIEEA
jgi:hypothetical protein